MESNSLNGLFGRLLRKLLQFAANVYSGITGNTSNIATYAENQICEATNNYEGGFWNKEAIETPIEEEILTNLTNNEISPFLAAITLRLDQAFQTTNISDQVAILNEVNLKIEATINYFLLHYENQNLSQNALDTLEQFIELIFEPLTDIINKTLTENNALETKLVTKTIYKQDLNPINITLQSFSFSVYEIYVKQGNQNSPASSVPEIVQTTNVNTENVPQTPNKKIQFGKILFVSLLLYAAYDIFQKKENVKS